MAAFIHRFRVRYHECDPQGVVFNANHITYVDVALTEMWRSVFGPGDSMAAHGVDIVVVDVHASFRGPARFDDEVELAIEIERFGRTSMTSRFVSRIDGKLCVEGSIVHVWIDRGTGEPVEPPAKVRELLTVHTA